MPRLVFVLLAGLLLIASPQHSGAQEADPIAHQHPSTAVIDGATHPELIPDSVAYRL